MSSRELQKQWDSSYLAGGNMAYVEGLYEDYLINPDLVPEDWRQKFAAIIPEQARTSEPSHKKITEYFLEQAQKKRVSGVLSRQIESHEVKQYQVASLINAYRNLGHQAAKLDPLDQSERPNIPNLDLGYHHLNSADLNTQFYAGKYFHAGLLPLIKILEALKKTYCSSIGIEYMHISNNEETQWLQAKMEITQGCPIFSDDKKRSILKDLIAADGLEKYLGTRYVGQKRFSLEGGDALIPMMKEIINLGGTAKVAEMVIGMAHRGRLNLLVNVLGKEPDELFQEFEGKIQTERTGDVKYHMGFSSNLLTESKNIVHVSLAFNPSHLEIIDPVVEGSARSRLKRRNDLAEKNSVVPIIIHGDAAFAGQGVVMETFNFSQARGYCTGGTIHIVINNQIGFTTSNPLDARSTLYCTDVAKMVQAPIFHVNGNDPEAVIFVTQIAFEFRMRFKRDVVIDLVCYRRNGHNEADDPSVTQPLMYRKIKSMSPLKDLYAAILIKDGIIAADETQNLIRAYRDKLDAGQAVVSTVGKDYVGSMAIDWMGYYAAKWDDKVDTSISNQTLDKLAKTLEFLPKDFKPHPVVEKIQKEREQMSNGAIPINWGYAETMAFASLLDQGIDVRLSGQDSGRGTFAHRHAVLYDNNTGVNYIPLERLGLEVNKRFEIIDSILSEEAVLGFEYGYASSEPESLVIWEAQYGDFANGAQVVIDQFISSGEQKWGRLCGLVMLLPHGYEGQGPEHSSARLERYMQLCAQHNIQVCVPTTPAQIFHLLRRQMLRKFRKPLIVMAPKSLLRNKLAVSSISDLTDGHFYSVIPEIDPLNNASVSKVVLCCGKIYYDVLERRRQQNLNHIAIIRIEQLYPFPQELLITELAKYPKANNIVWCQEEPENQGAWFASQHNILKCINKTQNLSYVGRSFAAAPAVGSPLLHVKQQEDLVMEALHN